MSVWLYLSSGQASIAIDASINGADMHTALVAHSNDDYIAVGHRNVAVAGWRAQRKRETPNIKMEPGQCKLASLGRMLGVVPVHETVTRLTSHGTRS